MQSIYLSNVNQFGYKGLGPSKALGWGGWGAFGEVKTQTSADVQRREDGKAGENAAGDERLNAAKKKGKRNRAGEKECPLSGG